MDIKLRPGKPEDAETCAQICYDAFTAIVKKHDFPPDVPASKAATGLLSMMLSNPKFYSVVAEANGQIVGSNFLDERSAIVGVGPITVDPAVQDGGVGRALMQDVIRRATDRAAPGIRLLQSAYHNRSLSLYAKLGFQVRDLLGCMQGRAASKSCDHGWVVRRHAETGVFASGLVDIAGGWGGCDGCGGAADLRG